jgi:hypothetical protein
MFFKMVDSFYLCIACTIKEKKKGQKKVITATNFVRIEGGPFWGFAAGRKFRERFYTEEKICT